MTVWRPSPASNKITIYLTDAQVEEVVAFGKTLNLSKSETLKYLLRYIKEEMEPNGS